jgi:hypothetical protein
MHFCRQLHLLPGVLLLISLLLDCPMFQLAEIVEQTHGVKKAVEVALAKQFAGRRVNVLGEINNALTAAS